MLINIIAFIAGFMLGCVGFREAIKAELRKCKSLHEQLKALERMEIIEKKQGIKQ